MTRSPARSRADIRLGRFLEFRQQWRRRSDGTVWEVHQVIRTDCVVELVDGPDRLWLSFTDLRRDYRWIAAPSRRSAAA